MMILVNGGSSCGKSAFAESLIVDREKESGMDSQMPSFYLATMIPWDEECKKRIQKHRAMRKNKHFETMECPVDLMDVRIPRGSRCLLECMSNLVANEMYREDRKNPKEGAFLRILSGIQKLREQAEFLVVVTNDVFGDRGVYSAETEDYRCLLGRVNQTLSIEADRVYEVICGIPIVEKQSEGKKCMDFGFITNQTIDREKRLTLLVGGACQGKKKLAMKEAKRRKETGEICVANGKTSSFSESYSADVIVDLHEYIARMLENGKDISTMESKESAAEAVNCFLNRILDENPMVIITCDEIGCGIVPTNEKDRVLREMTGDACQYLAARAKKVSRVVCGLEIQIKGGET